MTCVIASCPNEKPRAFGLCNAHYLRQRRYGDPLLTKRTSDPFYQYKRFWMKVNLDGPVPEYAPDLGPCWIWTAYTNEFGYGEYNVNGRAERAHRVAYETELHPIPEGLQLDHLCRVPACVNPFHLEPVTMRENLERSPTYPAHRTHCPQGHPYDEANTYYYKSGGRACRECHRVRENARYHINHVRDHSAVAR